MPVSPRRSAAAALVPLLAVLSGCALGTTPDGTAPPGGRPTPAASTPASVPASDPVLDVSAELSAIEAAHGVTVGVSAEVVGGPRIAYREDGRFGYASTLKVFAAATLLDATTPEQRAVTVTWTQDDLDRSGYSPVTAEHLATGMTLEQLAEAAVRSSDNTAMNLVLDAVGGPTAVQQLLRTLGDEATRVGAGEPELNAVAPGSDANTTTPAAFTAALRTLFESGPLPVEDRATLLGWMSGNATGDALIRAGAPQGWDVADKSGGAGGIRDDIAVVTAPDGRRIYVSILTTTRDPQAPYDDAVLAEVARAVLAALT